MLLTISKLYQIDKTENRKASAKLLGEQIKLSVTPIPVSKLVAEVRKEFQDGNISWDTYDGFTSGLSW